jgi:ferritin-like metal-binding protein YciE
MKSRVMEPDRRAEALGHDDIARLLNTNLNEEKAADKKLSTVAVRKGVNRKAAS